MPDWSMSPPQPAPPGPTNDVTENNPDWANYIKDIVSSAWTLYYNFPVFHPDPEDWHARIEVEFGDVIWVPLEGEDPRDWAPNGGVKTGELEGGVATRKFDFTRYVRTYPSITLQQFREVIISVYYSWGSWWRYQLGQGRYLAETVNRTAFWESMGDPQTFAEKKAYRWRVTSEGSGIRIVIGKLGENEVAIGAKGDRFIPNPPPNDSPPVPDDFDDEHENPWSDIDLSDPWDEQTLRRRAEKAEKLSKDLQKIAKPLQEVVNSGSKEKLLEVAHEFESTQNISDELGIQKPIEKTAKKLGWSSEPVDLREGRWVHSSIIKKSAKKSKNYKEQKNK